MNFYGLSSKRRRGSPVPSTWTPNAAHQFETGASSLIWRARYGSDGYWCLAGRKNTNTAGVINYATDVTGTWNNPAGISFGNGEMVRFAAYDGTDWGAGGYADEFDVEPTPPSGTWASEKPIAGGTPNWYGGDTGYGGYWAIGSSAATIYYSNSWGTWNTATESLSSQVNGIHAGSDDYWISVGGGNELASDYQVPSSWTNRTSPMAGGTSIKNAAYGNGYWVIVGDDAQLGYTTTPPTGGWTLVDDPGPFATTDIINNVYYGNGVWTIVGSGGKIATQELVPTGAWTTQVSGTAVALYAIGYGNGYWVAAGASGVLLYSQVFV